jgi:hypothetical protein
VLCHVEEAVDDDGERLVQEVAVDGEERGANQLDHNANRGEAKHALAAVVVDRLRNVLQRKGYGS